MMYTIFNNLTLFYLQDCFIFNQVTKTNYRKTVRIKPQY